MSYSQHLVKGLKILGERWYSRPRAWIAAGENWLDKALRMVLIAVPGYVLWRVLSSSWQTLIATVVIVCLLALRAATKAAKRPPAKAEAPAEGSPAAAEDGLPEVPRDAFVALVRDVLGTAPAAHLTTLATALVHRVGGPWEGADVRALARVHGIDVRAKVRDLGGARVSAGIHRDDLPSPEPLPEGAQEGLSGSYTAGQDVNATQLQKAPRYAPTPTETRHGGLRVVAVDDPDNPARTHVTVVDSQRKRTG